MTSLYYILLTAVIIFLISMAPLKVKVKYLKKNDDDELVIKVFMIKWLVIKIKFPFLKMEHYLLKPHLKVTSQAEGIGSLLFAEDKERLLFPNIDKIPTLYKIFREKFKLYKPSMLYLLRKTRFQDIRWQTSFGLEDPFRTGILTGAIWSVKNIIISKLDQLTQVSARKTKVQVVPCFTGANLSSYIYCIFDVRIGHIIITGLSLIVRTLFKGGKASG